MKGRWLTFGLAFTLCLSMQTNLQTYRRYINHVIFQDVPSVDQMVLPRLEEAISIETVEATNRSLMRILVSGPQAPTAKTASGKLQLDSDVNSEKDIDSISTAKTTTTPTSISGAGGLSSSKIDDDVSSSPNSRQRVTGEGSAVLTNQATHVDVPRNTTVSHQHTDDQQAARAVPLTKNGNGQENHAGMDDQGIKQIGGDALLPNDESARVQAESDHTDSYRSREADKEPTTTSNQTTLQQLHAAFNSTDTTASNQTAMRAADALNQSSSNLKADASQITDASIVSNQTTLLQHAAGSSTDTAMRNNQTFVNSTPIPTANTTGNQTTPSTFNNTANQAIFNSTADQASLQQQTGRVNVNRTTTPTEPNSVQQLSSAVKSVLSILHDATNKTALDSAYERLKAWDKEHGYDRAENQFSACILVMDENHRLAEWLAYHYFTLPLRNLIVAVDPRSHTSPHNILEKWHKLMNIRIWSDGDLSLNRDWKSVNASSAQAKTALHRLRQAFFYRDCSLRLKKDGKRWTAFHDVDEFIMLDNDFPYNATARMAQHGSVLDFLKYFRKLTNGVNDHFLGNCITLPRVLFGAKPSRPEEVRRDVPAVIADQAHRFETLQYRHRANHSWKETNGPVKSIYDVRFARQRKMYSVHKVAGRRCPQTEITHAPIGINHYVGSWEYYTARDDARRGIDRTREKYLKKAQVVGFRNDDQVRPWIAGFVKHVGDDLTKYLLHDVGVISKTNQTDGLSWKSVPISDEPWWMGLQG